MRKPSDKIVTAQYFHDVLRPMIREEKKSIGLCHGVFDLVHPGHIIHFKQASEMADVLVVSVTAAAYVRKGPGRPYFDDEKRLEFLSSIEYIDYVILSEGYTVDDIVEAVEPDLYIKGAEYKKASDDVTGGIEHEERVVEEHGGKLAFTAGDVFSSTKLINNALNGLPAEVKSHVKSFKANYSIKDIQEFTEKIQQLKFLVIGDTIIDRYTYCRVQGLMSKDMAYSARSSGSEDFWGGAVAIARHLATFTRHVSLISVIGSEPEILSGMNDDLAGSIHLNLCQSREMPTIIKQRFVNVNAKRDEYKKIFSVNNIAEPPFIGEDTAKELYDRIDEEIDAYDAVFLCDFGHGMISAPIMELVQKRAKCLILNCQTNSSNSGFNLITKYHRADYYSLDQKELQLAYPEYEHDEKEKLEILSRKLGGTGFLTRGAEGAYGCDGESIISCPALTLQVKDTIGAGDSFFAVSGAFAAAGADMTLCTFMGNIGGALGANIVGNKEPIEKINVLKFASTLLNI